MGVILYCYSFGGVIDGKEKSELDAAIKATLQDATIQETTTIIEKTTTEEITEETTTKEPITQKPIIEETTIKKQSNYIDCAVPDNTIKSYMDYKTITSTNSKQYKLQKNLAYTDSQGLRMVNGRYCVVVGSYYTTTIGQYIDIELENGKIIKGVLADCKADIHTDSTNRINPNGSVVEFIVDTNTLDNTAKKMGDISYVNGWNSKIVNIRVYDTVEKF
jgi:hypothetical protein